MAKETKGTQAQENVQKPALIEEIPAKGGKGTSAGLGCTQDALDMLRAGREAGRIGDSQGVRVVYDGRTLLTYREAQEVYRSAARQAQAMAYSATTAIRWCGEGRVKTTDKTARKVAQWGAWLRYKS